jgi:hypothetical protein
VSGKKSKTDQVQITTSDDDFTEPIAESTTNYFETVFNDYHKENQTVKNMLH